jgi:hypothetical protein
MGCSTQRHVTGARDPEVALTSHGVLTFRGTTVDADDLPRALEKAGYQKHETIIILVPADLSDLRLAYYVMGVLAQRGYRRPVLVKERRAYSVTGDAAREASMAGDRALDGTLKKTTPGKVSPPRKVIYRR